MSNYLFAYATNISEAEMHKHCPNAVFRGYGLLNGFKLEFCGYTGHAIATLTKDRNSSVNVAVWEMMPEDYYTIGNFEQFPYMYKREKVSVLLYGRKLKGDVYLLRQQLSKGMPSQEYLDLLNNAYIEAGWSTDVIKNALKSVQEGEQK
ncbi:MAG: gamma-glutamylcyclotransferase [Clostridia bacterium]|nr:gamma-glutamylcyclotransferase [Clostridia bacterium]